MRIMVYSLLWLMQDFYHQPYCMLLWGLNYVYTGLLYLGFEVTGEKNAQTFISE